MSEVSRGLPFGDGFKKRELFYSVFFCRISISFTYDFAIVLNRSDCCGDTIREGYLLTAPPSCSETNHWPFERQAPSTASFTISLTIHHPTPWDSSVNSSHHPAHLPAKVMHLLQALHQATTLLLPVPLLQVLVQ